MGYRHFRRVAARTKTGRIGAWCQKTAPKVAPDSEFVPLVSERLDALLAGLLLAGIILALMV
jgi:hypothetical protein